MTTTLTAKPNIVSQSEWQAARDALGVKEKAATRARDALSAQRRRLPMYRIDKRYVFEGEGGEATLADLFEGRRQLLLYHFMFGPDKEQGCVGCSWLVDSFGNPAHLNARDTTLALVSRAPLDKLLAFKKRMGWTLPWYSSFASDFNDDLGVTTPDGEMFGLSALLRDGDEVYRTYFTTRRGCEYLGNAFTLLDLTPLGRQEEWEDSPDGWPQTPPYTWWRHHDRYEPTGDVHSV